MDALKREVAKKQQMLEQVESSRMDTRRRVAMLELANRTLRSEWDNALPTVKVKVARLEERIG